MRQGQSQNRQRNRGRGGNRGNRNNINRSMESNGPDVRIRGTAAHIAEKYQQLARDALSSGDGIAAESYWQHAEHYNRLIAAAQLAKEEQQMKNGEDVEGNQKHQKTKRQNGEQDNSNDEENENNENGDGEITKKGEVSGVERINKNKKQNEESVNGAGPQPTLDEVPAEVALSSKNANENGDGDGDTNGGSEKKNKRTTRRTKKNQTEIEGEEASKEELPPFISGEGE